MVLRSLLTSVGLLLAAGCDATPDEPASSDCQLVRAIANAAEETRGDMLRELGEANQALILHRAISTGADLDASQQSMVAAGVDETVAQRLIFQHAYVAGTHCRTSERLRRLLSLALPGNLDGDGAFCSSLHRQFGDDYETTVVAPASEWARRQRAAEEELLVDCHPRE